MNVAQAVQRILDGLTETWNARDWASFCSLFSPDADYVTGSGEHLTGRDQIRESLSTRDPESFHAGEVVLVTTSLRPLGPDAASVLCSWRMGPGPGAGRSGHVTIVAQRAGGVWSIVALQNTDTVP